MGQEQEHDRDHRQDDQNDAIVHRFAEEHEGLVAEEVEEEPGGHHDDEDDERDRVPEEAEEEDQQHHDRVVHPEVGDVRSDSPEDLAERRREVEGSEVEHELPWPASAEAGLDALLGARDVLAGGALRRRRGRDRAVGGHGF